MNVNLKAQTIGAIREFVDSQTSRDKLKELALKEVLPKDYARAALDKQRLGQIIDFISNIRVGDAEAQSKDVLGDAPSLRCGYGFARNIKGKQPVVLHESSSEDVSL